jgi:hypothetical protein
MGIETKSKDLQIFHGGNKKADWDVGITVDAIRFASKVDTIILATGDGDFVPLVEHLKSLGVQVEVVSFGRSTSAKLKETTEAFLDLDESPNKYLLLKPTSSNFKAQKPAKRTVINSVPVVELEDAGKQSNSKREPKPRAKPGANKSTKQGARDRDDQGEARQSKDSGTTRENY